jgi:hypothetical protein
MMLGGLCWSVGRNRRHLPREFGRKGCSRPTACGTVLSLRNHLRRAHARTLCRPGLKGVLDDVDMRPLPPRVWSPGSRRGCGGGGTIGACGTRRTARTASCVLRVRRPGVLARRSSSWIRSERCLLSAMSKRAACCAKNTYGTRRRPTGESGGAGDDEAPVETPPLIAVLDFSILGRCRPICPWAA